MNNQLLFHPIYFNFNGSTKHRGKIVVGHDEGESLRISWLGYPLSAYPPPTFCPTARMRLPLSTNGSKGNDSSCKSSWSSDDEFSVVSRCELSSKQARHYCCLLNEKLHKSWWKLKFPSRGGNQNKFDFCYFWYYSHLILFSTGTLLGFLCPHQSFHIHQP